MAWVKAKKCVEVAPPLYSVPLGIITLCIVDVRGVKMTCGKCGYTKSYAVEYAQRDKRCKACGTLNRI